MAIVTFLLPRLRKLKPKIGWLYQSNGAWSGCSFSGCTERILGVLVNFYVNDKVADALPWAQEYHKNSPNQSWICPRTCNYKQALFVSFGCDSQSLNPAVDQWRAEISTPLCTVQSLVSVENPTRDVAFQSSTSYLHTLKLFCNCRVPLTILLLVDTEPTAPQHSCFPWSTSRSS